LCDKVALAPQLDDDNVGDLIQQLLHTTTSQPRVLDLDFDPKTVAGTWKVIHAPHIVWLSNVLLLGTTKFGPIEYHLTVNQQITSCVKYTTTTTTIPFWNRRHSQSSGGWLCTSGYYTNDSDDCDTTTNDNSNTVVRIVWDMVWWNTEPYERPTPPNEGSFPNSIQGLGTLGFVEPLSFFPVLYVDEQFVVFQFFGLTITAMKEDSKTIFKTNLPDGILVSQKQTRTR
jgi:hypothetical protein